MIENHDVLLFQIEITILHNSEQTTKQIACNLLEVLTKCQLLQSIYIYLFKLFIAKSVLLLWILLFS